MRDAFDLSQPCTEQMGLNHDVACSFEPQLKNTCIRLVLFTSKAMTVTKLHGLITVEVECLRQFHTSGQVLVDDVSEKEYCA